MKVRGVVWLGKMPDCAKNFEITGGSGVLAGTTKSASWAMFPGPTTLLLTVLVVFRKLPVAVASMFTLKTQVEFAPMFPPDRLTVFDPATAVMTPLPHPPDNPFGVATTSPAGSVSLKLVSTEPPNPVVIEKVKGVV